MLKCLIRTKWLAKALVFISFYLTLFTAYGAHEITFCGESIPVSKSFVAEKLMNIIRQQIGYVNMPQLRRASDKYLPVVEYYLRESGLPEDFKYLPIIESGFANRTSMVGAQGMWQLMPGTARELGLVVNEGIDQRNEFHASTLAACRVLADYYKAIRKKYGISSWVLTAAAYNFGIGNVFKSMDKQGKDYFSMQLNPETAVYVYKLIAVKELFEYPELYLKKFTYNVFNATKPLPKVAMPEITSADTSGFGSMVVKVSESDGLHPETLKKSQGASTSTVVKGLSKSETIKLLGAHIKGKYKNFQDGDLIAIELQENLQVRNRFLKAGNVIKGIGWIINDRVFIDLGYDDHDVILYDGESKRGIALTSLKNNEPILLKVQVNED